VRVFFDATVWCGAIIRPQGANAKLLSLAAVGGPLKGFTSDVVLLEFYRHAVDGTLSQTFEADEVKDYIEAHGPLLDVAQAPIGRALPQRTDLHHLAIGEIVYELTGQTRQDLLDQLPGQPTLPQFDIHDLHVVAAAVQCGADAICSSDPIFVPIGDLAIFKPGQLAREFGLFE
jgi:predicted nucleic acid-binding protein